MTHDTSTQPGVLSQVFRHSLRVLAEVEPTPDTRKDISGLSDRVEVVLTVIAVPIGGALDGVNSTALTSVSCAVIGRASEGNVAAWASDWSGGGRRARSGRRARAQRREGSNTGALVAGSRDGRGDGDGRRPGSA
jgi:hypothetical protein